jgi:hypothetical protein
MRNSLTFTMLCRWKVLLISNSPTNNCLWPSREMK